MNRVGISQKRITVRAEVVPYVHAQLHAIFPRELHEGETRFMVDGRIAVRFRINQGQADVLMGMLAVMRAFRLVHATVAFLDLKINLN